MTTAAATESESFISQAKEVSLRIKAHNVVVITAGIAFYGVLALIPTIVAVISLYSLITDPADIAEQITNLTENLEEDSAQLIQDQVTDAVAEARTSGVFTLVLGIVLALWASSGAVQKMMATVALAYGAIEGRKGWQVRLIAYGLTAGGILTVALIGFVFGALPSVLDAAGLSGGASAIINMVTFLAMFFFMMFAFTVLYRYGPDRTPKTPWKNPGAVVGAVMFGVFALLFSLYFTYLAGAMPASYGILGSIAAIIIFLQLTAISVVIGAEVNAMREDANVNPLDQFYGAKPEGDPDAEPLSFGKSALLVGALFLLGKNED